MRIEYGPRGMLMIDDATLIFKNFSGAEDKFNRKGDRNFAIRIFDTELADALTEQGWNIKVKPPRDEDEEPFMWLPVKIKFNDRGPNVYLKTGAVTNELDEEGIGCLDNIDIACVDLDVRPYDWEVNGKTGRTAYLQSIHVTQNINRFAERYSYVND